MVEFKEKVKEADAQLDELAAKIERHKLTKWLLVGIVVLFLIAVGLWASKAFATGYHAPVAVAATTTAAPAAIAFSAAAPAEIATTSVSTSSTATTNAAQQSAGAGAPALGVMAMVLVGVFFYAVICSKELHDNAQGWWARNMCIKPDSR